MLLSCYAHFFNSHERRSLLINASAVTWIPDIDRPRREYVMALQKKRVIQIDEISLFGANI